MAEIQSRWLSYRQAWVYCGISRHKFDSEVRPHVIEIPKPGSRHGAIQFDRLELDEWMDQHKDRHGRPGAAMDKRENESCYEEQTSSPACKRKVKSGISTKKSGATVDFVKALEQIRMRKRSDTKD